ncbi:MAG: GAF domain-containing sensor histidine kinase [Chloroflexi bacterium]|nr:GAF domain-containing sensor histidine kinase [Chloroflexota bacterium]
MILVFFINGLAFFIMGLVIILETRRPSKLKLAESLWFLTVFAWLRSLGNWAEMFLLIQGAGAGSNPTSTPASNNLPFQAVEALLLPLATIFLLQFGANLITTLNQRYLWLRWVPLALIALWLLVLLPVVYSSSGTSAAWLLAADVWARYFLYLPGAVLAGLAVFLYGRRLSSEMNLPRMARDYIGMTAAFGLKAIVAGLVVPPAPYFPASLLNESSFLAVVGLPVQVFRTITTLAIAYFIVGILKAFEGEQNRQMEIAIQQHSQAQQEALEAQRQARAEMEQWNKQLEDMVNTIATAIGQPLELREILNIALHKALELPGLDSGGVFLVDEQAQELVFVAHHGLSQRFVQAVERMKLGEGIAGRSAVSGEPIIVENLSADPRLTKAILREEGIRFHASVPLKCRGRVLGIMNLSSKSHRSFTPQEVILLTAIGQQIGVAIENARLYQQVRHLAALEERDRLARELHDYLAQALSYLNLEASVTDDLLSKGQIAQAQASLREMKKIAQETYTDVREAIFSLRAAVSGLLPTLRDYLDEYRTHYGVDARLVVDSEDAAQFSPDVDIQLLRIIQEALTNVRKHAQASHVWVRFAQDGDWARITVKDDGRGFDPAQLTGEGRPYFGLQIMRERAEGVGGSLELTSRPGQGTRVVLRVPLTPGG